MSQHLLEMAAGSFACDAAPSVRPGCLRKCGKAEEKFDDEIGRRPTSIRLCQKEAILPAEINLGLFPI